MSKKPYVCARIVTPNKHLGHVVRRYTYQGKRFDCDHGWYKVGRGVGEELAQLKHPSTKAKIFEVVEAEEAESITKQEQTEEWGRTATPPSRASAVKITDFARRKEIQKAEAARTGEGLTADEWDDPVKPHDLTDADSGDSAQVAVEQASPTPVAKKKATKKTGSRRRSATK